MHSDRRVGLLRNAEASYVVAREIASFMVRGFAVRVKPAEECKSSKGPPKTRYRSVTWGLRTHGKKRGWAAPSFEK